MIMNDTIRVAYICSTREFAGDERMQTEDGRDVSAEHRGSLPELVRFLEHYNSRSRDAQHPRIEIALILVDDDSLQRNFSDLGIVFGNRRIRCGLLLTYVKTTDAVKDLKDFIKVSIKTGIKKPVRLRTIEEEKWY